MNRVLLVGCALDGPINQVVYPKNLDAAVNIYGGKYSEAITVTPSSTAFTLAYEPLSTFTHGFDSKSIQLYAPSLSGSVMTFGNIGGSGSVACKVEYQPYLGMVDLLAATRHFFEKTGIMPYVARAGGSCASLTVQGWTFESKHLGPRGNLVNISYAASAFTITGLSPEYNTRTYMVTGSAKSVADLINRDFEYNLCPLKVVSYGATALSSFSSALTGGSSGSISEANLAYILDNAVPMDVSAVILLSPLTSGMMATVANSNSKPLNNQKIVLAPALSYTGSGYLADLETAYPQRSPWVGLILGTSDYRYDGVIRTRQLVESVLPAMYNTGGYSPTNKALNEENVAPMLAENWLLALEEAGVMSGTRYIGAGDSIYRSIMSDGRTPFGDIFYSTLAVSIATNYLYDYVGKKLSVGRHRDVERELFNLLSLYLSVAKVTIEVIDDVYDYSTDSRIAVTGYPKLTMLCYLDIRVYDEIKTISLNVRLV